MNGKHNPHCFFAADLKVDKNRRKRLSTVRSVPGVVFQLVQLVQVFRAYILCRYPVFLIGPGAQVNQLAAVRAEGALRIGIGPFHGFTAGGAFDVHGNLYESLVKEVYLIIYEIKNLTKTA
jgi:hypothetical protein